MKASEVIKKLQMVIDEYGDKEVTLYSLHTGTEYEVDDVEQDAKIRFV